MCYNNQVNEIWRHGQAVRQRSATPLSPVRFRVTPPAKKDTFKVSFFAGGVTPSLSRVFWRPRAQENRFAFAARRSESDSRSEAFSRRRACEFSPKVRFREKDRRRPPVPTMRLTAGSSPRPTLDRMHLLCYTKVSMIL